jgi:hypothetical protein
MAQYSELPENPMRVLISFISAAAVIVSAGPGFAATAGRLAPKDIETTFFNGQPFTASTLSNVKFKMVFSPDGTMTREPVAKAGAKSEGTWRLTQDGFCSTWKGSKANCFQVRANGQNKWSVIAGTQAVATWSK